MEFLYDLIWKILIKQLTFLPLVQTPSLELISSCCPEHELIDEITTEDQKQKY